MDNTTQIQIYSEKLNDVQKNYVNQLHMMIMEIDPSLFVKLSWGAPTYYINNQYCLQIAANKNHIGFYTSRETISQFKDQLSEYKTNEKNTIQFTYNTPLPKDLIQEIISFHIKEKLFNE